MVSGLTNQVGGGGAAVMRKNDVDVRSYRCLLWDSRRQLEEQAWRERM